MTALDHVDEGAIRLERGLIDPTELFGAAFAEPLSLSFCGVSIVVAPGSSASVRTTWADGRVDDVDGACLPTSTSAEIFARTGAVTRVEFTIDVASLEPAAD